MFRKCCWCNQNSPKKTESILQTAAPYNKKCYNNEKTNNKELDDMKVTNELPILDTSSLKVDTKTSQSSDIRIDLISDTDDEVFCEGVGPPVHLANNLGVKDPDVLPKWFKESNDLNEPTTPPATPVGKDELALKRHRLFSEIIDIAQHSAEHRVKFDPFGPVVARVSDDSYPRSDLEDLICRLESVTTRLENIPIQQLLNSNLPDLYTMSVQGFTDIIQGPLAQYIKISQQIGGDVGQHSQLVQKAFQAQLQYLNVASQSKQPSQSDILNLLKPTSDQISAIQDFREKHRTSQLFNHLSAISESIPALGWVTVGATPGPYVKEMNDAGQFYTNRVLKDWKEKDKKHVEWVKAWVQTLTDLQAFIKQYHTTGLVWAGKGSASVPPPPPPGCPPPPPVLDFADVDVAGGDADRSALFAQINQGENITSSLRKVTSDMQTHKNPTLREGPAPFKTPSHGGVAAGRAPAVVDKPPSFVRDGKKWIIEYQKGSHNLVVENAEMNNVVYLFKCTDSTVTIKGKINSITLDSCKKTSVVFDSLVSSMEFINCQSVQMQVLGKVPTISIDKTDGCQMYLSPESLDVEIVSSKSSEMNVLVPKGNGDYTEYPVPEQYKTTVVPGKGLSTIIIESKG